MNKVCIIGTLVRDPETRHTPSGNMVCNISIALNEKYGENEHVNFFECDAWNKTAELIEKYFHKGHKIGITGRLRQERWEDHEGKTKSRVKIVIENIDFLQGKRDKDGEYKDNPENDTPPARSQNEPDNPFDDSEISF